MLTRIKKILTYYDSEPTEIMQGIIWFILFPVVFTIEHGCNIVLLVLSILVGFSSIFCACYKSVHIRKIIAQSVFSFSLIVVTIYFLNKDLPACPTHWGWVVVSLSAFFNLKRLTNHYYISLKKNGNN